MDQDKLRKIQALASGGATLGEKSAAKAFLDKYEVEGWSLESEPEMIEIKLVYQAKWQRNLAATIVYYFGYQPHRVDVKGKRQKYVLAEVPSYVAEFIVETYQRHRGILREKMNAFAINYAVGAFPTDSKNARLIKSEHPEMSTLGKQVGEKNQQARALISD